MIDETIKSIEENDDCDEMIFMMKSGRSFKVVSYAYYGGESSLSWEEIESVNSRPNPEGK